MKRIVTAVLIVLTLCVTCTVAFAQVKEGTYKLPSGIIVTDDIPVADLPANVATMTAREFRAFATVYNTQQAEKSKARHTDYLLHRQQPIVARINESSGSNTTRIGGGYGAGGFGGAGGYSGYGSTVGGGLGLGLGLGRGSAGNMIQSSDASSSRSYTMTFPDMNDSAGPINIINPYCFREWVKEAKAQAAREAELDAQTAE